MAGQDQQRRITTFLLLSSDCKHHKFKGNGRMALNNFIQYSHCQVVQLVRLTSLIKAFTAIITNITLCTRIMFSD